MESIAIISHLLHFVMGMLAVLFCITLFRRHRARGWLFVSVVFLEPFVRLLLRAINGHPLLAYKTYTANADGGMTLSYRFDFPFLYIAAVFGLYLLVRESQEKVEKKDDAA